ncbi:Uncharacterised protein [Mycobacteroides abscessus subsp. abscessus]|nr:Uncharacterised protein [Mycobacteroides abscessus]SIC27909.1 Uncharacterised protein [Mycobacteroides abscessus subsp. abscessus]SIL09177.1 Uncharacterised protein [Mycobacteroides abscessus subsp. abscessus]SIM05587.1 Uncharacterised protein [Mycobacteroides abscessus subsp. abscessus]
MMPTMTVVARASWAKSAQRNRWMSELTAGKPATETVAWASEVLGRAFSAVVVMRWARFMASTL